MKNYYAILEVPVGCSLEEIRQAYHRLVQAHLDDEAVFAELKEAYEVLTTPTRRAEYDQTAWGETFDSSAQTLLLPMRGTSERCPMGPESSCPVVQGRTLPADKFCPDCGYALSGLTPETAFDTASLPDPAHQARLEDRSGQSHPLRPGSNLVGREGTDVLVFDKTVSRNHARLEVADDGTVSVEDLSSTNGTQVGGERLMPHALRRLSNGDTVQFGSVSMTLHLPETVSAPSSAPAEAPVPEMLAPVPEALAQVSETREGSTGVHPLLPGITTFGRRPENKIVLTGDLYVSGSHAQISADGAMFILTDIGSTNGTLLNGARLEVNTPVSLDDGDLIVIGATAFRFDRLGSAGTEPAEEPIISEQIDIEQNTTEQNALKDAEG